MTRRLEPADEAAARLRAEALTPGERASLWMRIDATRGAGRRRLSPVAIGGVAFASLAAAALVVFWITARPETQAPAIQAACRLDAEAPALELPDSCEAQSVRVGEDEWRLMPGSKVSRAKTGPVVESGRVEFRVHPRSRSHFRVEVGAGHTIRVVGTVFRIVQQGASGSVSVSEGVIEFVWNDGTSERVAAGQTLQWPRPSAANPRTPAAQAGAEEKANPRNDAAPERDKLSQAERSDRKPETMASQNLESVMDRVLQLKSQRRFGELVSLLEQTLASGKVGSGQRERLSYELGLALEGAGRSACGHWKRHVQAYGVGRHGGALEKRLERCKP